MTRVLAVVALVLLLAVVVFSARKPWRSAPPPEETVFKMFSAAQSGEVERYLDSFHGALRDQLSQQLAREGRDSFARNLVESTRLLTGVFVPAQPEDAPGGVRITAELIFPSRTERQTFLLVRAGRTWKISQAEAAQYSQPLVPYGSPVHLLADSAEAASSAKAGADAAPPSQ